MISQKKQKKQEKTRRGKKEKNVKREGGKQNLTEKEHNKQYAKITTKGLNN